MRIRKSAGNNFWEKKKKTKQPQQQQKIPTKMIVKDEKKQ